MRKLKKSFETIFLLILAISLFSCSSNDDTVLEQIEYSNKIDFEGQSYQVSGGLIDNGGGNNDYSMALYPAGITIKDSNNNNVFNGGDWFLEIATLITEDNTIEGTYKSGEDVFIYFIDNAQFVNDQLQPGKIVHEVNQNGILNINKLEGEYEFIYKAFDDRDIPFTVYYKGSLTEFNY